LRILYFSVFIRYLKYTFFFFFANSYSLLGQTYTYDVLIDDKPVGKMQISRSSFVKGLMVIDLNLDFSSGTIGTNLINQYGTSYFKKGILTDSESILERNNRIREQCRVRLEKGKYGIIRRNENKVFLEKTISTTLISMYFSEPRNVNTVFSERFGDYCELKALSSGVYEVTLPMGGSIRYYYKNGLCYKTESKGTLQDLQLKLKSK
jgi:hypothetical protein